MIPGIPGEAFSYTPKGLVYVRDVSKISIQYITSVYLHYVFFVYKKYIIK